MSKNARNSITSTCSDPSSRVDDQEKQKPGLVGRNVELNRVVSAYQQQITCSSSSSSTGTILIRGSSGVGKTAFLNLLREPIIASQGFVCGGKFCRDAATQEPYSAFLTAFSDLCDLVLRSNDVRRTKEIKNALRGPDGVLLSKMIANLATILNCTNDDDDDDLMAVPSKTITFPIACRNFLRAIASPSHPVVVMLDDIQWMDEASRLLLELLMKQDDDDESGGLPHLLFVFSCRDDGMVRQQLFQHYKTVIDIKLTNLNEAQIHQMISSNLNCNDGRSSTAVKALSSLIFQQSAGNPFFALQFLDVLKREGQLTATSTIEDKGTWELDIENIHFNAALSTANVLERKIQHLENKVLQILQVASILGRRFKISILERIFKTLVESKSIASNGNEEMIAIRDSVELHRDLLSAVEMGFIEKVDESSYQFSHDKIHAALHDMIKKSKRREIHKAVAETYHQHGDSRSDYRAAVHFNQAHPILINDADRTRVALINMTASEYCNRTSAFYTSAVLLREAINCIPKEGKWTINYNLTLKVYNSLLREELAICNYDACKVVADTIFQHAKSPEDKVTAWVTVVECDLAQYDSRKCMESAAMAMKVLGITIPARIGNARVLRKLLKIKYMLRGQTDEDILSLPLLSDEVRAMQVKVLLLSSIAGMIASDPGRSVYSALLAMEICIKEGGLSPYVPSAFAIYSVAELMMGNRDRAYRFGQLVMSMLAQMDCKESVAPAILLVTTLVLHWRHHVRDLIDPLKRCVTSDVEGGHTFYAVAGAASYVGVRFFNGDSLVELEAYARTTLPALEAIAPSDEVTLWLKPNFQQVLNLRATPDDWQSLTELTGEVMVESEFVKKAVAINEKVQLSVLWMCKLPLAYHFNCFALAESVLLDLSRNWQAFRSSYSYMTYYFYGALTYLELFRIHDRRKYLRMAKRSRRALEKVPTPNSLPLVALLVAEEKSICTKRIATLENLYSAAIRATASGGFYHMEALANERAAFLFCKLGYQIKAERYFLRAIELYEFEWGAIAKCEWLGEQSEALLAEAKAEQHNARSDLMDNMDLLEERSSEFTAN